MSFRLPLTSLAWVGVAVLLRVYGYAGGDASIVGGILFFIWTAPFGLIWQLYIYSYALTWRPVFVAQVAGDVIVVVAGFLFWFVFFPRVRNCKNFRFKK